MKAETKIELLVTTVLGRFEVGQAQVAPVKMGDDLNTAPAEVKRKASDN